MSLKYYNDGYTREEIRQLETEKVTATYWATIHSGKIVQLADGFPAQELNDCQIILSDEEFNLLRTANLEKIERLVKQIKAKIKVNGS